MPKPKKGRARIRHRLSKVELDAIATRSIIQQSETTRQLVRTHFKVDVHKLQLWAGRSMSWAKFSRFYLRILNRRLESMSERQVLWIETMALKLMDDRNAPAPVKRWTRPEPDKI